MLFFYYQKCSCVPFYIRKYIWWMINLIFEIYLFFYIVLKIASKLKHMTNHIYYLGKKHLKYCSFTQLLSVKSIFLPSEEHLSLFICWLLAGVTSSVGWFPIWSTCVYVSFFYCLIIHCTRIFYLWFN